MRSLLTLALLSISVTALTQVRGIKKSNRAYIEQAIPQNKDGDCSTVLCEGLNNGTKFDSCRRVSVSHCRLEKTLAIHSSLRDVYLDDDSFDGLYIDGAGIKNDSTPKYRTAVFLGASKVNRLQWSNCRFADVTFQDDTIDIADIFGVNCKFFRVETSHFKERANIRNSSFDLLYFYGCSFKCPLTISSSPGLKKLRFEWATGDQGIDLSDINMAPGSECELTLIGTDASKIKLNYVDFKLVLDSSEYTTTSSILYTYRQMLKCQLDNGFEKGYRKLDIEYKDFLLSKYWNFQDYLSKIWWNYGYNKEYIFSWTWKIFLAFYIVVLTFFNFFISKVYDLESLRQRWESERTNVIPGLRLFLMRVQLSFLYSAIIFFGIKLDVSKLKFLHIGAVILIYGFYLMGILCVVFIGNYLLLK
jgi:hypothetical protein